MAVTIDADALGTAIAASATDAARLLAVATELVDRYTGGATVPDPVSNEAVIRVSGWLKDSPASGVLESRVREREFRQSRATLTGALRASGAMSLLRPYKPVGLGVAE